MTLGVIFLILDKQWKMSTTKYPDTLRYNYIMLTLQSLWAYKRTGIMISAKDDP